MMAYKQSHNPPPELWINKDRAKLHRGGEIRFKSMPPGTQTRPRAETVTHELESRLTAYHDLHFGYSKRPHGPNAKWFVAGSVNPMLRSRAMLDANTEGKGIIPRYCFDPNVDDNDPDVLMCDIRYFLSMQTARGGQNQIISQYAGMDRNYSGPKIQTKVLMEEWSVWDAISKNVEIGWRREIKLEQVYDYTVDELDEIFASLMNVEMSNPPMKPAPEWEPSPDLFEFATEAIEAARSAKEPNRPGNTYADTPAEEARKLTNGE